MKFTVRIEKDGDSHEVEAQQIKTSQHNAEQVTIFCSGFCFDVYADRITDITKI